MASTSVSSIQKSFQYDVFLSFRGEDTRRSFVDHLYHALEQKSIDAYRDDEKIKKGERIGDQLIRSIEESKFYIIVFSKNYTSSSWCLDELVKIIECQKTREHTAYPVFYDVEPTDVRNQKGEVGKAFAKHIDDKSVGKWREALEEAANLAGWELKNTFDGHEAKLIQEIVKTISQELRYIDLSIDSKSIGMEKRVRDVVSSLETCSDDVRVIGIKGIGGGGKTTLAKAVFNQIYDLYEGSSFVENVRESTKDHGLKLLQKQILLDVLNDSHIIGGGAPDLKSVMRKKMRNRKVLVVLDDVDHLDQLEALAGETNWFKPGSRVIITTRDKQVLAAHRVPENLILDVNLLSDEEANCLFNRYAFGSDSPNHGFEMLSKQFVRYAHGLPLTIKVLGAFLCNKDKLVWSDALDRLKVIPLDETLKKLELSYDSLEKDYKEIFLDVACILIRWKKEKAIVVLERCGYHARTGLNVLEQKSLIRVSKDGRLRMHDHIEEMGENIVRRLHPNEPYKHSRLWNEKEIMDILIEDKGTEETRCISAGKVDPVVLMKGLRKMKKLRFLMVKGKKHDYAYVDVDEDSSYLPDGLQYLHWSGYPFTFLPKSFQAGNLVGLKMAYSNIQELWKGGERKDLKKLRFIDLHKCELRTLDIGLSLNLERLNVKWCINLLELHMPVKSSKLKFLSLIGCGLYTLDLSWAQNLDTLHIEDCDDIVELHMPVKSCRLKILGLKCCGLNTLDLSWAQNLDTLEIAGCADLEKLHMPVESPHLKHLKLQSTKLRLLSLKSAINLKSLDVSLCEDLEELQMPVENVELESVKLECPKLRTLDLAGAHILTSLSVRSCSELVKLRMPVEKVMLESVKLHGSKIRTLDLLGAQNLASLDIGFCLDLEELHMPIGNVELESVVLNGSNKLRTLDLTGAHNLVSLSVINCFSLVELHMPVEKVKLEYVRLCDSNLKTLDLSGAQNIIRLEVLQCKNLVELHMPVENAKLKFLEPRHCKLRTLDLTSARNLNSLTLYECEHLVESNITFESLSLRILELGSDELQKLNLKTALNLEHLSLICYKLAEIHAPIRCLKDHVQIYTEGKRCNRLNPFLVNQGSPMLITELHLTAGSSKSACELHPDNNLHNLSFTCTYKEPPSPLTYLTGGSSKSACELHPDNNLHDLSFTCTYKEPPSPLTGNFEKVIFVNLLTCKNLASFLGSSCNLQFLKKLTLESSIPEEPIAVEQLECLEELTLDLRKTEHLPDSICMLKHLKSLMLEYCWLLKQLPEDLGRLECLETLGLSHCTSLRDIPNSICEIKRLQTLRLTNCILFEKLPNEIGRLNCLNELNIEGTSIMELPQSIFQLKGLRITASKGKLRSYGITSKICSYIRYRVRHWEFGYI